MKVATEYFSASLRSAGVSASLPEMSGSCATHDGSSAPSYVLACRPLATTTHTHVVQWGTEKSTIENCAGRGQSGAARQGGQS
jgi:hypothetical protein